jgi:hypothetical protein
MCEYFNNENTLQNGSACRSSGYRRKPPLAEDEIQQH